MNIYVNFKKPPTLTKFLEMLFSHNGYKSVETYFDKECKDVQCHAGRFRSIDDLHSCVNTYFPKVELSTLIAELIKLKPRGRNFFPFWCSDIQRCVFNYEIGRIYYLPAFHKKDYDWNTIFTELGITTPEELYNYK